MKDRVDWTNSSLFPTPLATKVVSPIQDQGNCGACWAFSTMTILESAYAIKYGKLQKMSE